MGYEINFGLENMREISPSDYVTKVGIATEEMKGRRSESLLAC